MPFGVGQVGAGAAGEVRGHLRVVQQHGGHGVMGEVGVGLLGDQHHGGRVLDDEPQPLGRLARVQGQVGGAGLEDGQQCGQQPRAAFQGERHDPAGPRAVRGQQPGEPVGLGVERGVREPFVPVADGRPFGPCRHLCLEQFCEGPLGGEGTDGRVAGVFTGQQDVQVAQRRHRSDCGQPLQHRQEPLAVQGEFVFLVQGGIGVEGQPQAAAAAGPGAHRDLEVVDGSAGQVVPGGGVSGEDRGLVERDDVEHRSVQPAPGAQQAQVAAEDLAPVALVAAQGLQFTGDGPDQLGDGRAGGGFHAQGEDVGGGPRGAQGGAAEAAHRGQAQHQVLGAGHPVQVGGGRGGEQVRAPDPEAGRRGVERFGLGGRQFGGAAQEGRRGAAVREVSRAGWGRSARRRAQWSRSRACRSEAR